MRWKRRSKKSPYFSSYDSNQCTINTFGRDTVQFHSISRCLRHKRKTLSIGCYGIWVCSCSEQQGTRSQSKFKLNYVTNWAQKWATIGSFHSSGFCREQSIVRCGLSKRRNQKVVFRIADLSISKKKLIRWYWFKKISFGFTKKAWYVRKKVACLMLKIAFKKDIEIEVAYIGEHLRYLFL